MISVEHAHASIDYVDLIIIPVNAKFVRFQGIDDRNVYLSRSNNQRPTISHGRTWITITTPMFILYIRNIPNIATVSSIINNLITIF